MSKRKQSKKINIGDIFAVPLDPLGHRYGYVRMSNNPDVAVLGVVSGGNLLNIDEVVKYQSVMDVFSLRTSMHSTVLLNADGQQVAMILGAGVCLPT